MTELAYTHWSPHPRCFYCNRMASLEELLQVDAELSHWDTETLEQINDQIVSYDFPAVAPFVHVVDGRYPILNLCNGCYVEAAKNSGVVD